MHVQVGTRLPDAALLRIGDAGPEPVALKDRMAGRKVLVFGLPGAFTPTCDSAHVPSFIRVMGGLREKGIDEVICIAVNDPHVMRAWGEASGAAAAGITLLADADSAFTKAIGMDYDAPAAGMFGRSKRYALVAEDGVVTIWHPEPERGCTISSGEAMLAAL